MKTRINLLAIFTLLTISTPVLSASMARNTEILSLKDMEYIKQMRKNSDEDMEMNFGGPTPSQSPVPSTISIASNKSKKSTFSNEERQSLKRISNNLSGLHVRPLPVRPLPDLKHEREFKQALKIAKNNAYGFELRHGAISKLASIDKERAYPHLLKIVQDKKDWTEVRQKAIEQLAILDKKRALIDLVKIAKDKKVRYSVRSYAIDKLAIINCKSTYFRLGEMVDDETGFSFLGLKVRDEKPTGRAYPELLKIAKDKKVRYSVRHKAMKEIASLHEEKAYLELLKIAKDETEWIEMRQKAIEQLAILDKERAYPHLLKIVQDKKDWTEVRQKAIEQLAMIDYKRAYPELLKIAKDETDWIGARYPAGDAVGYYKVNWFHRLSGWLFNPIPKEIKEIKEAIKEKGKEAVIITAVTTTLGPGPGAASGAGIVVGNEVRNGVKKTQVYQQAKQKTDNYEEEVDEWAKMFNDVTLGNFTSHACLSEADEETKKEIIDDLKDSPKLLANVAVVRKEVENAKQEVRVGIVNGPAQQKITDALDVIEKRFNTLLVERGIEKKFTFDSPLPNKPDLTFKERMGLRFVEFSKTFAYKTIWAGAGVGLYYIALPYAALFPKQSIFILGTTISGYALKKTVGLKWVGLPMLLCIMVGLYYILYNDSMPKAWQREDVKMVVKEAVENINLQAETAPIRLSNAPKPYKPMDYQKIAMLVLGILMVLGLLVLLFKKKRR